MAYAFGFLLWLALAGFVVWTIIDVNARPDWAWERIGQNKQVWFIVPLVTLFFCGIVALVMGIIYHASIKPKLEQVQGIT